MTYRSLLVLALLVTIFALALYCIKGDIRPVRALFVLWALVPPAWFNFEHRFFFQNGRCGEVSYEEFKHYQHLAAAQWLGVVAVLGLWLSASS